MSHTIKKILLEFLSFMLHLWSSIYNIKMSQRWNSYCDLWYTLWISNFLGRVGEDVLFSRHILLQGEGHLNIMIGSHTRIAHHVVLGCWKSYGHVQNEHFSPQIVIGDNCHIGEFCHITAINIIKIGDGLLTGRFVYIGDNAHGGLSMEEADIPPVNRHLYSKGNIVIGKNVWIGDKATILGGVKIGNNVIIGANSVVTHDLPDNCIACGVPCKVLKILEK